MHILVHAHSAHTVHMCTQQPFLNFILWQVLSLHQSYSQGINTFLSSSPEPEEPGFVSVPVPSHDIQAQSGTAASTSFTDPSPNHNTPIQVSVSHTVLVWCVCVCARAGVCQRERVCVCVPECVPECEPERLGLVIDHEKLTIIDKKSY